MIDIEDINKNSAFSAYLGVLCVKRLANAENAEIRRGRRGNPLLTSSSPLA